MRLVRFLARITGEMTAIEVKSSMTCHASFDSVALWQYKGGDSRFSKTMLPMPDGVGRGDGVTT